MSSDAVAQGGFWEFAGRQTSKMAGITAENFLILAASMLLAEL
jgi:hypothetical protein